MSASEDGLFRLIRINSKNRISGSSSDFVVDFSDDQTTNKVREIHFHTVTIPHVFFNINSNNNILNVTFGVAGGIVVTIAEGWYTIDQLIIAIKGLLDIHLVGSTSDITKVAVTGQLIFAIAAGGDSYTISESSPLAPYLGIYSDQTVDIGNPSLTEVGHNLIGPQNVFISSSTLSNGQTLLSSTGSFSNTCLTVPITAPYGGLITYQTGTTEYNDRFVYDTAKDVSTIDIQLNDEDGNLLILNDNTDCIITLKMFYVV